MAAEPPHAGAASPTRTLGWAAYLACSWTWCIGMFLAVLLVRDFGLWGFLVFAAPNILGAAGMGWVLRSQGLSGQLVERHRTAMVWFTCATLGFHVFWLAWLAGSIRAWIVAPGWTIGLGAAIGLVAGTAGGAAAWRRPIRWATLAAPVAIALSLIAMAILLGSGAARIAGPGPHATPAQAPDELLWLAPVVVFGFALCPYLDLTFHRARQALAPVAARAAFSIGFGIFFLGMILLTLVYSGWLAGPVSGGLPTEPPAAVALALAAHIVAQATFTVLAHASAVQPMARESTGRLALVAMTLVAGPGAALLALNMEGGLWGLSVGELAYRSFMGLYGLVFPAYVWLVMIPGPSRRAAPTRPKLLIWAATVIIAAPFFAAGFLARESHWLVPGMAIVLAARFLARRADSRSRTAGSSE